MELFQSWWEEKRSAYLYQIIASEVQDSNQQQLFIDLAKAAEEQAKIWEGKYRQANLQKPLYFKPDIRTRVVIILVKLIGVERLPKLLSALKIRGMSVFTQYHSETKHTHLNAASNLRAAIFGVNDGLVSNMSLIIGVAAAGASFHIVTLTGLAGLLAGAASMAAGEYISVRSQRDIFEYQIDIERVELEEYPEEEASELSRIYQARGVPKEDADHLSNLLIKNPDTALNTLAREELGLNPEDLVSPVGAMIASFVSFSVGAFIPLFPFLFPALSSALVVSLCLTGVSLFLVGALLSLYTNQSLFYSGLRMLAIGSLAGVLTYIVGSWFGASSI